MKAAFVVDSIKHLELDDIEEAILSKAVQKIRDRRIDRFKVHLKKASRIVASWPDWKRKAFGSLIAVVLTFCTGCQFSGGTALPPLPGLIVETPSGYKIQADSNVKGFLEFEDGDKKIKVKLTQDVSGVVDSQAGLAQGLEGLAKIESQRQEIWTKAFTSMLGMVLEKLNPVPAPPEPVPVP